MRFIVFYIFFISFLTAKEVSVLGAGNLNSTSPYGLTQTEKAIYKNKKKIKILEKKIKELRFLLDNKISDISEQVDGFKSVYEGDSYSLKNISKKAKLQDKNIKNNQQNIIENSKKIDILEQKIDTLSEKLNNFIELQEKNNISFRKDLQKLTKVMNVINNDYVSEAKFKELVDFVNKNKIVKKKLDKKYKNDKKRSETTTNKKLSKKQTLQYAINLYKKNYLTKSKPYFLKLYKQKYKLDIVSFYLGKISYFKKQYKNAIFYFKKSMVVNDESTFVPELLYYSAKSFVKLKDIKNAVNFYNTLIDVYPEDNYSIKAKKDLSRLKK